MPRPKPKPSKSKSKSKPRVAGRRRATPPRVPRRSPTRAKGAPSKASKGRRAPAKKPVKVKKRLTFNRAIGVKRAVKENRVRKRQGLPTPRRRFKTGPAQRTLRSIEITLFKAEGSIGKRAAVIYGGLRMVDYEQQTPKWAKRHKQYLALQSDSPKGYPNAPGVWTSVEGLFLGQVNFPGRVSFATLNRMLSKSLGLVRGGGVGDFRNAYPHWSYTYQVYRRHEVRNAAGRIELGKPVIVYRRHDSS